MATFGVTADNSDSTASSADRSRVSSASPSSNGTVESLTCRCWVDSGSTVAKAVIYSDTGSNFPNNLLAVSDELSITNNTEQANTFTFSGANRISVTSGTTYWIGVHWQDPGTGNFFVSRDATAGGNKNDADTYSDGPETPYNSLAANSTGIIDAFVTYTADEAPATAPRFSTLSLMGVG